MKGIINKVVGKIFGENRKFFPVVNKQGIVEKPKKFFPVSETEYLLAQRRKGICGNGYCTEQDF